MTTKTFRELQVGDAVTQVGDVVMTNPITITSVKPYMVRGTGSAAVLPDGRPAGSFWPSTVVGPFVVA
jgi:hypothetical protein